MLGVLEKVLGKLLRTSEPVTDLLPEPSVRTSPQAMGSRRSLAKMTAKKLAFEKDGGKYQLFEPRPGAGVHRLLGCGPTLNVDGTPMVGDTGYDERGKPYGVTQDCR